MKELKFTIEEELKNVNESLINVSNDNLKIFQKLIRIQIKTQ